MMMMMMMMMVMTMYCFCGMVDRRKAFSFISSCDHHQRSSPLPVSDMPRAGFEPAQNLSIGLVEWSCDNHYTTASRKHDHWYVLEKVLDNVFLVCNQWLVVLNKFDSPLKLYFLGNCKLLVIYRAKHILLAVEP